MNGRCGQKPTGQSVFTEHDRFRNLRFMTCVGICEHSYEGTACDQQPHYDVTYDWTILAEPKSPANLCPRQCMETDEASLFSPRHAVRLEPDFLDPWSAIAQAFELELDVVRDGWTQDPLHDDEWSSRGPRDGR